MRVRFIALALVVALVVVAWLGAWFAGASYIRTAYDDLRSEIADEGGELTCGRLDISGLPFRFDLFCHDLTLKLEDITAKLPLLEATVRVYAPTHILAFANGPLTVEDAFTGTRREADWELLEASARTNWAALANISLVAKSITLKDTLVGEKTLWTVDGLEAHLLDDPQAHNRTTGTAQWSLYAIMNGTNVSDLDINAADFRLEADLPGMPDDLRNFDPDTIVSNWIAPNPPINLHVFEGKDATTSFSLTGNLGLEEGGTWQGDFDLASNGLDKRLDPFVVPAMRQILLGDPASNGDGLYRAYSIRHSVLFAGNVPLTVLPALP